MDNLKHWIWLNSINGVGPVLGKKLLDRFKNPKNIWEANINELRQVDGIGDVIANQVIHSKDEKSLEADLERIVWHKSKVIKIFDEGYPKLLKEIYDPPILLYTKGNITQVDNNAIAIVGSRMATNYGLQVAYNLAKELSQKGITIVSGLAKGIDTAAHRGALDGGGRTIAVLGNGLDIVYPSENRKILNEIINNGAVVTEYKIGTVPDASNFPRRNRIISGISKGVIIIEAGSKSGSLITAEYALEQNREVFAIPGQINCKSSEGTNNLIKQGAKLVTRVEDIIEELNIETIKNVNIAISDEVKYNNLNDDEKIIISNILYNPIHLENLKNLTGFSIDKLNILITMLELKGFIKQLPGKEFVRT